MNKQELIKKYVYMKRNLEMWVSIPDILGLKNFPKKEKHTTRKKNQKVPVLIGCLIVRELK